MFAARLEVTYPPHPTHGARVVQLSAAPMSTSYTPRAWTRFVWELHAPSAGGAVVSCVDGVGEPLAVAPAASLASGSAPGWLANSSVVTISLDWLTVAKASGPGVRCTAVFHA
jgi:hypothetical protein